MSDRNELTDVQELNVKMWDRYKDKISLDIDRPSWPQFYMTQAIEISKRSPDAQTKHGCVFTDMEYHPLSQGYNAPGKGLPHSLIPNLRPEKYPWFIHSEINAIINSSVPLWSVPLGIKAFITGIPCLPCLNAMINCNLRELYYFDDYGWSKDNETRLDFQFAIEHAGIKLFPQDKKNFNPTELK